MAREDNLLNGNPETQFKSGREAVENGRKGGVASGVERRRRKTFREALLLALQTGDTQDNIIAALINEAIEGNSAGSVKAAFETIRDTIGEKPIDKLMVAEVDQSVVSEVEAAVMEESLDDNGQETSD